MHVQVQLEHLAPLPYGLPLALSPLNKFNHVARSTIYLMSDSQLADQNSSVFLSFRRPHTGSVYLLSLTMSLYGLIQEIFAAS